MDVPACMSGLQEYLKTVLHGSAISVCLLTA